MTSGSPPPIDPSAARASLQALPADAATDLVLVSRTSGGLTEVTTAQPSKRLQDALRETALGIVARWAERELLPYAVGQEVASHQVMWVSAASVPGLAIDSVGDELADLPQFDPTPETLSNVRLSVIRLHIGAEKVLFLRAISRTNAAGLKKKLAIFKTGSRLDLAPDTTLFVERVVDAIVIDGVAMFVNRTQFERAFGFLEQLKAQATATFNTVTTSLPIKNMDEFKAAATGQLQMLAKMASIEHKLQQYPKYKSSLTMANLVKFIQTNPQTGVKIEGSGAGAQLVFESDVQHRFKILKLLDDDYLKSQLTEMDYEANSKGMPI